MSKRRLVSNQTIFDRSVIVAALISEMKLNSGRPVGISAPFAAEKVRDGCDSLFACFHGTLRIVRKMKSRCNSAVRCRMQVMEGRFPSQEDSIEQLGTVSVFTSFREFLRFFREFLRVFASFREFSRVFASFREFSRVFASFRKFS